MPITTAPIAGRPAGSNGEFTTGLFDCCGDTGSCLKSYCCPCLVAKDVADHMGDNGTVWCCMYLAGLICTGWPYFFCVCFQRNKLRQHQGIEGGLVGDALASLCCSCCVLTQMDKEVKP